LDVTYKDPTGVLATEILLTSSVTDRHIRAATEAGGRKIVLGLIVIFVLGTPCLLLGLFAILGPALHKSSLGGRLLAGLFGLGVIWIAWDFIKGFYRTLRLLYSQVELEMDESGCTLIWHYRGNKRILIQTPEVLFRVRVWKYIVSSESYKYLIVLEPVESKYPDIVLGIPDVSRSAEKAVNAARRIDWTLRQLGMASTDN